MLPCCSGSIFSPGTLNRSVFRLDEYGYRERMLLPYYFLGGGVGRWGGGGWGGLIHSLLPSVSVAATNYFLFWNSKPKESAFTLEQGSIFHLNDDDSFHKSRGETLSLVECAEESEIPNTPLNDLCLRMSKLSCKQMSSTSRFISRELYLAGA